MKAYQIRIELIGSNPLVWRRFIIPADVTFKRLHDTIQFSMDWYDCHLYEFKLPEAKLIITNDVEACDENKFYLNKYKKKKPTEKEDPHGAIARIIENTVRRPQTLKIDKYIEEYKVFEYVYDFGDGWTHKVELENIIYDHKFGYPVILAGEGACPPEDVGGIEGYKLFLEAWNNPNHEDHKAIRQWGESQNYGRFDMEFRNNLLKSFLKLKKNE
ncbi:plasmid pRiA4b ORF-3 family protein [Clostridium cochlearium]|uniref:Plasmid pRiA4b ORF-3-like protein n=1 Tax=Clostridium cochlearium TaxID=1494 RepID=A0A2X2WDJ2_CLOCO|nr:plasmid pRiA4b ORF-3 family protein [Clostridium cochlearium]SQB35723.1 Plasmid pRiA4b ORF-3-like protein [Clostridium cochlearium]